MRTPVFNRAHAARFCWRCDHRLLPIVLTARLLYPGRLVHRVVVGVSIGVIGEEARHRSNSSAVELGGPSASSGCLRRRVMSIGRCEGGSVETRNKHVVVVPESPPIEPLLGLRVSHVVRAAVPCRCPLPCRCSCLNCGPPWREPAPSNSAASWRGAPSAAPSAVNGAESCRRHSTKRRTVIIF